MIKSIRLCVNAYFEQIESRKFSYHEPFFGGGAVFFDLFSNEKINKAYLNDINSELIVLYKLIKSPEDTEKLYKKTISLEKKFNESAKRDLLFSEWKSKFNKLLLKDESIQNLSKKDQIEIGSLLIALNKTCFNGLYRKNKKGEFNVPFGKKFDENVKFLNKENYKNVHHAFKNTKITNTPFENAINFQVVKPKHLVFLDPPYVPISKTAQFKDYYNEGFTLDQHKNLSEKMKEIDENGSFFILTNSNTKLVEDIYLTSKKYFLYKASVTRSINQKGRDFTDTGIRELIITNFKVPLL